MVYCICWWAKSKWNSIPLHKGISPRLNTNQQMQLPWTWGCLLIHIYLWSFCLLYVWVKNIINIKRTDLTNATNKLLTVTEAGELTHTAATTYISPFFQFSLSFLLSIPHPNLEAGSIMAELVLLQGCSYLPEVPHRVIVFILMTISITSTWLQLLPANRHHFHPLHSRIPWAPINLWFL